MTHQRGSLEFTPIVRVLVLLFADVGTDLFQLEAHRGHRVAPRPEVLTREVALLAPKLPGDGNRTLPFQEANHLRHRHFGGNGDTHMNMIRHDMPLDDLTLFLARQRMEDRPQLPTNLSIQLATASLGDKHDVILAIPFGMRQAPIIVFHYVLLWLPHQAHLRRTTPVSVKPLQVSLVEPVAYPPAQLYMGRCAEGNSPLARRLPLPRPIPGLGCFTKSFSGSVRIRPKISHRRS